jgi:hypothetical protein
MAGVHCFTSISFSYLDRARVLAETVKKHHPDWTFWLCLSDREPEGFQFKVEQEIFDRLARVEDLDIPELDPWIFQHGLVELCTAVKGPMLCHLLEQGADKVIYFDPDIALFSSLDDVVRLLDEHAIVLTPHLSAPEETWTRIVDNEIDALKHGTYNLGFLAVSGLSEGMRFAHWWRDRLIGFCYDDLAAGLFTDQKWCDLVPALFDGTVILRDPGYNVASWNVANRPLEIGRNGTITAAGRPLRFFHFTKVDTIGEMKIEQNSGGRSEAFELLQWYRERLKHHAATEIQAGWWAFACYENGAPIERGHRVLYRRRRELRSRFPRPFASGPDSYQNWCARQVELKAT